MTQIHIMLPKNRLPIPNFYGSYCIIFYFNVNLIIPEGISIHLIKIYPFFIFFLRYNSDEIVSRFKYHA